MTALRKAFSAAIVVLAALAGAATAQEYPAKRITIVVPVPPGGPMDFAARLLATEFQTRWKQPVIVDNRPGAGALIGAEVVARAAPDGYTLLVHNTSIVAYPIFVDTKFSALRDLAPISAFMHSPYVLVGRPEGQKTLKELIQYTTANPDKLNVAVIPHTLQQLRTFKFLRAAGVRATMIPYPGTAPILRALLANEVQIYMASPFGIDVLVKDGRLRASAMLANEPYWALPDIPTAKSQGVDFETSEKYLVFAPAETPHTIINKVSAEIGRIVGEPRVQEKIRSTNNVGRASTPAALAKELIDLDREALDLAKQADIKK